MLLHSRMPLLASLLWGLAGLAPAAGAESVAGLVQSAGNSESERQRYELLLRLEKRDDLPPSLRDDLETLLPVVNDWANGREHPSVDSRAAENGYLCRFIKARPAGEGPVNPPALSEGSPLRPIWAFYRARMLIWQVIQSGPLFGVKEAREPYFHEAARWLEETAAAFPHNRVVKMYMGQPIPWPKRIAPAQTAPEWANLQREGLEKLTDVIEWWIAERQLPDGQFGGGWGDDVEMWRWWAPVLVGFEHPGAAAAQERLADALFQQPHLKDGFTSRLTDVEHASEDTTDTILPMMLLNPEDPLWKGRAHRLLELMRARWTGRNQRGFLQFKSIYFGAAEVDGRPARAFDTVYHPAVIQPCLLYWQRTADRETGELVGEWLKGWVDATARAENGKPAGVLPSAVQWPSGRVGAPGRPWWEPFPQNHNDRLYNWPGAAKLMTSTLLLAWRITGDGQYLKPIESMAALAMKPRHSGDEGLRGGEAWTAAQLNLFLPDTIAKYRFLTGDQRFDALLQKGSAAYTKYRLTGQIQPLVNSLRKNAEAFRSNWEAYTSEMRWTDRVLSFTRNFLQYLPAPAPPAPSPDTLYSSLTGDPGTPLVFPLNAVRWLTPPRELAALVTNSGKTNFAADLFHFGAGPRPLAAEFLLLDPGGYTLTVMEKADGRKLETKVFNVTGPRARVQFTLPPGRLCELRVTM